MKTIILRITWPGASTGASLSPALAVRARMLRRSMLALLLAAFMQGIAFAVFIPIIDALLRETRRQLLNWAMAFSVAAIVTLVLRWYGLA
mgnify:CR=1 FL=1